MANKTLSDARKNKDDEFYTRLEDISEELNNYKKHFKDKIVLCNCDDPEWSNFWIFLHQNFSEFGIKKLISTHYNADGFSSYVMEYTGGNDIDPKDWHQRSLKGNGDFASDECVALLKEADLVATNPPWSLFRKYVDLLLEHEKDFIIIGNKNAISDKDIFPLFKNNKIWLGYSSPKNFRRPDGTTTTKINGLGRWFTNLDIPKRHKKLIPELHKEYKNHLGLYEEYDNYDVINIDKVKDIPYDYFGPMGVPITFIDKYNPDEFELLDGRDFTKIERLKNKDTYLLKDADGCVKGKNKYARIIVKRRDKNG